MKMDIEKADRVEVLTLQDNYVDFFAFEERGDKTGI